MDWLSLINIQHSIFAIEKIFLGFMSWSEEEKGHSGFHLSSYACIVFIIEMKRETGFNVNGF